MSIEKTVSPGRLLHSISPWCWLTIDCAIARPSPLPSARQLIMGTKILSWMSAGTPGPLSQMSIWQTRR